jgi:hypothetical protein
VNGLWLRAAGAEDSMRPRRLVGASGRPLNFTVRAHLWNVATCCNKQC